MADSDLSSNYVGAFDGALAPGTHPAVLLVDMVRAYFDPESPLYCETAKAALDAAVQLVASAREAGHPVVFTNVEYQPGGADGGLFYRKVPSLRLFDQGSVMGAFAPELSPEPGDLVITKQYPSAFFGTALAAELKDRGIDTLLVCGYSTSGCVRASALDALQNEFAPMIVPECCADRHAAPHEANLFDLQAKYAEIMPLPAAQDYLASQPAG